MPRKEAWKKEARRQMLSLQVRVIRKSKGLSVSELADRAGYEPSTIRKIENGTFLPEKGKDISLANALGVSLDQLWGRKRFKDFFDNGQPKLYETDKIALTLLAPLYKAMSREGRATLLDVAAALVKSENADIEWDEYSPSKDAND